MRRLIRFLVGTVVLTLLAGILQASATPIQQPTRWLDNFVDDMGLYTVTDTAIITETQRLTLRRSTINPDQYVTSGLATSVLINPLVASIPTTHGHYVIEAGKDDFMYLMAYSAYDDSFANLLYSYRLTTGQFQRIHAFPEGPSRSTGATARLAIGTDRQLYIGLGNELYRYNPNGGAIEKLATVETDNRFRVLAAAPSGLIYGIAGPRLFSFNPATSMLSDLGIIAPSIDGERDALVVAGDGRVYGGYTLGVAGRLFIYDPITRQIQDKGQVLGQMDINSLVAGSDGRIYGGTNSGCGGTGRFFAYDPATDSFTDLAGSYGGVYALAAGKDGQIYGAARRNGWEAYLFMYNPTSAALRETGRVQAGNATFSSLTWASDGKVYGMQITAVFHSFWGPYIRNLVVYDPNNPEFQGWDRVTFGYAAPAGTSIRVDLMDADGNVLLTDLNSGDSLSSIDHIVHRAVQLRVILLGNGVSSPSLDFWAVHVVPIWAPSTISGRILDASGRALSGVTLSVGTGYTDITNSGGEYNISDLPPSTYTLVPAKEGCVFSPQTRTVSVPPDATAQDFIGRCEFDVAGQVLDGSGNPFSGVTVTTSSGTFGTSNAKGSYVIGNLIAGTYELTPTMPGYRFVPAMRVVTVPPDAPWQNFTILAEPVSINLPISGTANLPATLVYTDTQGLPTTVEFPAGAVPLNAAAETFVRMSSQPVVTVVLTPTLAHGGAGTTFAGHAFDLELYQNGVLWPDLQLSAPVTVTIRYSAMDVRLVSDESRLAFKWWGESGWQDAAAGCGLPGAYSHDRTNRIYSTSICRTGKFGLFGPTQQVFLPLVTRR
jgi:hypothetical protein